MNLDLIYSRPAKTAAQLATKAIDHHRFLAKKVLLTGEPDILNTVNGRECFLSAFAAAHPHCPNIRIHIPAGCDDLGAVSKAFVKRIAFGPGVEHCDHVDDLGNFDAILSVGTAVKPDLPWTAINSNGWLARVSSGARGLPADVAMDNPVGALAAACLGRRRSVQAPDQAEAERGEMLDGFSFSLRSTVPERPIAALRLPSFSRRRSSCLWAAAPSGTALCACCRNCSAAGVSTLSMRRPTGKRISEPAF